MDALDELRCAVKLGNLTKVREILNSNRLLEYTNVNEFSLDKTAEIILQRIRQALLRHHFEIAEVLFAYVSLFPNRNHIIHFAARIQNVQIVQILLESGADANALDHDGRIPLFDAILSGNMEIIHLLLLHTHDVNCRDKNGTSLLDVTAEKGYAQIFKILLQHGAELNCLSESDHTGSNTVFHFAVIGGNEEIVEILLSKGADLNAEGTDGMTPLHIAAEKECINMVGFLLKHGALVNSFSGKCQTPLHLAVKNNSDKVCEMLLNFGADVDVEDMDGRTTLQLAVEQNNTKITKLILKHGPDLTNKSNRSALKVAVCDNWDTSIAEKLLEYGFEVNPCDTNNDRFFVSAVKKRCLKVIEQLIVSRFDVHKLVKYSKDDVWFQCIEDSLGMPIHVAVNYENKEVAELLINSGADFNAKDSMGKVPLMYAVERSNIELVDLLASKYRCDVNVCDKDGKTALHYTTENFSDDDDDNERFDGINDEIAELVLKEGANVNAKTPEGKTTLHLAVEMERKNLIKLLLFYNVDINSRDGNNNTPLHIAVQNGITSVVKTLLVSGANINCDGKDGNTALHFACLQKNKKIVSLLLEQGCAINITNLNQETALDIARKGLDIASRSIPYNWSCTDQHVIDILEKHIIKLKSLHLFVRKRDLLSIKNRFRNYQRKCKHEVLLMSKKIDNTNTSLYDLFSKGVHYVANKLNNNNVMQALRSDYKSKFLIYASMMGNHFKKGEKMRQLLAEVYKSCHRIFGKLPYDCIQIVLNYLDIQDLRMLVAACQPDGLRRSRVHSMSNQIKNFFERFPVSNISEIKYYRGTAFPKKKKITKFHFFLSNGVQYKAR